MWPSGAKPGRRTKLEVEPSMDEWIERRQPRQTTGMRWTDEANQRRRPKLGVVPHMGDYADGYIGARIAEISGKKDVKS